MHKKRKDSFNRQSVRYNRLNKRNNSRKNKKNLINKLLRSRRRFNSARNYNKIKKERRN